MCTVIRCPKCKGNGGVYDTEGGIFTCGIITLFEFIDDDLKEECPCCGCNEFLKID